MIWFSPYYRLKWLRLVQSLKPKGIPVTLLLDFILARRAHKSFFHARAILYSLIDSFSSDVGSISYFTYFVKPFWNWWCSNDELVASVCVTSTSIKNIWILNSVVDRQIFWSYQCNEGWRMVEIKDKFILNQPNFLFDRKNTLETWHFLH